MSNATRELHDNINRALAPLGITIETIELNHPIQHGGWTVHMRGLIPDRFPRRRTYAEQRRLYEAHTADDGIIDVEVVEEETIEIPPPRCRGTLVEVYVDEPPTDEAITDKLLDPHFEP